MFLRISHVYKWQALSVAGREMDKKRVTHCSAFDQSPVVPTLGLGDWVHETVFEETHTVTHIEAHI